MISRIVSQLTRIQLFRYNNVWRNNRPSFCSNTRNTNTLVPKNDISRRNFSRMPKTPDLIYIPHVYRWLKTKIQFKYLQKAWDPDFTEGAFIYGTSKAVCRITEIIHQNTPDELEGLLTTDAKIKLKEVMKTKLTKAQKTIIKITPDDIKILVPMTICMNKDLMQKNCKVGMRILALKWIKQESAGLRLVLVALQTEFLKDYREGPNSDWTISAFDILDCVILSQVQQ